jgi:CDP-diacylglycerol--glycerol-3-phosphate 3-phosphatidyltransferase
MIQEPHQALSSLRRQWLIVAALYAAAILLGFSLLQQALLTQSQQSLQWLTLAAIAMAIQLGILWLALPYNRRQGSSLAPGATAQVVPSLGYANAVTLLRGLFACMLAGFLFAPEPVGWLAWLPAILYTLDRLVDFVDGYVARVTRSETKLGEILDIEFDGLGILIAITLGIQYGKLPIWYLLLGLARQLFVFGMWLLRRQGKPVYDLSPSEHRRMIAGFQTGFITVVLWPLWPPSVTLLAAYIMAIPLVFSFGRDWLVVSGAIDPTSPTYLRLRARAGLLIEGWLPLIARLGAVLLALPILWGAAATLLPRAADLGAGATPPGASPEGVALLGLVGSPLLGGALLLLGFLAVLSVLLGAAGRLGALALAAIAALDIAAHGLHWDGNAVLLICTIIVVHLGSGKWALWRPEEPILRTKAGAAPKPPLPGSDLLPAAAEAPKPPVPGSDLLPAAAEAPVGGSAGRGAQHPAPAVGQSPVEGRPSAPVQHQPRGRTQSGPPAQGL